MPTGTIKMLGFVRKHLRVNSKSSREQAYKMLVHPKIEYAAAVWDAHTAKHINNIEKIQRRATRVVCNDHRQTSSVSEMLKILNWPSLQNRRRAASLSTLFKIKEGEVKIKSDHLHPVQARSRRGNDQQYATIGFMAKMTSDCIPSFEELSKIGTH